MTDDRLRSAIDVGDVSGVRAILGDDPAAVGRLFWWGDSGGGDYTEAIYYVSLARFHGAADHDRMGEIAQVLLDAGAGPAGPVDAAETPVVAAASNDEPGAAAALVEAGADPVGRGFAAPGSTALAHAVYFGNPAVAHVLLEAGAPIESPAEAAGTGRLDAAALEGANEQDQVWALRAAAVCERPGVINRLLEGGVPIGVQVEGATALHWAAFFGKPSAVRHLIDRSADPSRRDAAHDATPLDRARYRHRELFRSSPGHDDVERYLAGLSPD